MTVMLLTALLLLSVALCAQGAQDNSINRIFSSPIPSVRSANPSTAFLRSSRDALNNLHVNGEKRGVPPQSPLYRALMNAFHLSSVKLALKELPRPCSLSEMAEFGEEGCGAFLDQQREKYKHNVVMAIGFPDIFERVDSRTTATYPRGKGPFPNIVFIPPYRHRNGFEGWLRSGDRAVCFVSSSEEDRVPLGGGFSLGVEDDEGGEDDEEKDALSEFMEKYSWRIDEAAQRITSFLTTKYNCEDDWVRDVIIFEEDVLKPLLLEISTFEWDLYEESPLYYASNYILPSTELLYCFDPKKDYLCIKMPLTINLSDTSSYPSLRLLYGKIKSLLGKHPFEYIEGANESMEQRLARRADLISANNPFVREVFKDGTKKITQWDMTLVNHLMMVILTEAVKDDSVLLIRRISTFFKAYVDGPFLFTHFKTDFLPKHYLYAVGYGKCIFNGQGVYGGLSSGERFILARHHMRHHADRMLWFKTNVIFNLLLVIDSLTFNWWAQLDELLVECQVPGSKWGCFLSDLLVFLEVHPERDHFIAEFVEGIIERHGIATNVQRDLNAGSKAYLTALRNEYTFQSHTLMIK